VEETERPQFWGKYVYDEEASEIRKEYPVWKRALKYAVTAPVLFSTMLVMFLVMTTFYSTNTHLYADYMAGNKLNYLPQFDYKYYTIQAAAESNELTVLSNTTLAVGSNSTQAFSFSYQEFRKPKFWTVMFLYPCLYGMLVDTLSHLFQWMARISNNYENHRTQTTYLNRLVVKVFTFRMFTVFTTLFYIAFFSNSQSEIYLRVSVTIFCMMTVGQWWGTFIDICIPSLLQRAKLFRMQSRARATNRLVYKAQLYSDSLAAHIAARDGTGDEQEINANVAAAQNAVAKRKQYVEDAKSASWTQATSKGYDTFRDYTNIIAQLGFILFFSAIFPLSPLIALCNNAILLRLQAYKLCHITQRPIAQKASGIGVWEDVLQVMSVVGIISSCGILGYTSQRVKSYLAPLGVVGLALVLFGVEHSLLFFKYFLHATIPRIPEAVQRAQARGKQEIQSKEKKLRRRRTADANDTLKYRKRAYQAYEGLRNVTSPHRDLGDGDAAEVTSVQIGHSLHRAGSSRPLSSPRRKGLGNSQSQSPRGASKMVLVAANGMNGFGSSDMLSHTRVDSGEQFRENREVDIGAILECECFDSPNSSASAGSFELNINLDSKTNHSSSAPGTPVTTPSRQMPLMSRMSIDSGVKASQNEFDIDAINDETAMMLEANHAILSPVDGFFDMEQCNYYDSPLVATYNSVQSIMMQTTFKNDNSSESEGSDGDSSDDDSVIVSVKTAQSRPISASETVRPATAPQVTRRLSTDSWGSELRLKIQSLTNRIEASKTTEIELLSAQKSVASIETTKSPQPVSNVDSAAPVLGTPKETPCTQSPVEAVIQTLQQPIAYNTDRAASKKLGCKAPPASKQRKVVVVEDGAGKLPSSDRSSVDVVTSSNTAANAYIPPTSPAVSPSTQKSASPQSTLGSSKQRVILQTTPPRPHRKYRKITVVETADNEIEDTTASRSSEHHSQGSGNDENLNENIPAANVDQDGPIRAVITSGPHNDGGSQSPIPKIPTIVKLRSAFAGTRERQETVSVTTGKAAKVENLGASNGSTKKKITFAQDSERSRTWTALISTPTPTVSLNPFAFVSKK
jgi:hypothetical protein